MYSSYAIGGVDDVLLDLAEALPHGSGINYRWDSEVTARSIRFYNSYQAMDENGMYDGYADFALILPIVNSQLCWDSCKLQFSGRLAQYLNQKHCLREYLGDTLYYALSAYFDK